MPDKVVEAAAKTGWAEAYLVVIGFIIISTFTWVIKRILDEGRCREERLTAKITKLETEIHNELFHQIRSSTECMTKILIAIDKVTAALEKFASKPCVKDAIE